MKYVILQDLKTGFRTPVLCTAPMSHEQLAGAFKSTHKPVSAGFCEPLGAIDGRFRVFGYSDSLRLSPVAGDAPLIEAMTRATLRVAPAPIPA